MKSFTHLIVILLVITTGYSCKNQQGPPKKDTGTSANTDSLPPAGSDNQNDIVYVNIDTLMEKYQYFKDSQKKLESQFENSQKEIDNKLRQLQEKIVGYQQRAQEMTRQQLEEAERSLGAEQEALMKRKDQMTRTLAKAEEDLNIQLRNKINSYLENLAKANGYKFILSFNTTGLGMLYGDTNLDITRQVVTELNEAYLAEKSKK